MFIVIEIIVRSTENRLHFKFAQRNYIRRYYENRLAYETQSFMLHRFVSFAIRLT
jgi:hypothetical protein